MEELTFVFARLKGLLLTEGKAGRAVEDLAEAVKKSIPGSLGAGVTAMRRMVSEAASSGADLRTVALSVVDGTAGSSH
ncbi:hypothetical protein ACX80J_09080 [Arthrobacter sp. MDB2-24]